MQHGGPEALTVVNNLPLSGVGSWTVFPGPDGRSIPMSTRTITPRYFEAMGIPLLAGRHFSDADQATSPRVAIVNEYIARQLFPNISPIGQPLPSAEEGAPVVMIVGVVGDTAQASYDQPIQGEIYRPMRQFIFATFVSTVVVRTPGDPLSFVGAVRNAVWRADPNQPILRVQTMHDAIAESTWRPRFSAWIFSVLAILAVLLTAAGVYGVVAYTSSLRAREMGIRIVLGASPTSLIAKVACSAMLPICVGLAIGLLSALPLSSLLESLLYEVRGADVLSYLSAAAILLIIGAAASVGPAWRMVTETPAKTLRTE
jgi:putative ABC transport system permease protein